MKNTLKQVFHSAKFLVGFSIFVFILLMTIIYPLIVTHDPLEVVGNGNFFKPGTYISKSDAIKADSYTLKIQMQKANISSQVSEEERSEMAEWLQKFGGVSESDIQNMEADESYCSLDGKVQPGCKTERIDCIKEKILQKIK